jgi:hypothetical protein
MWCALFFLLLAAEARVLLNYTFSSTECSARKIRDSTGTGVDLLLDSSVLCSIQALRGGQFLSGIQIPDCSVLNRAAALSTKKVFDEYNNAPFRQNISIELWFSFTTPVTDDTVLYSFVEMSADATYPVLERNLTVSANRRDPQFNLLYSRRELDYDPGTLKNLFYPGIAALFLPSGICDVQFGSNEITFVASDGFQPMVDTIGTDSDVLYKVILTLPGYHDQPAALYVTTSISSTVEVGYLFTKHLFYNNTLLKYVLRPYLRLRVGCSVMDPMMTPAPIVLHKLAIYNEDMDTGRATSLLLN